MTENSVRALLFFVIPALALVGLFAAPRVLDAIRRGRPPAWGPISALVPSVAVLSLCGTFALQLLRTGLHGTPPAYPVGLERAIVLLVTTVGPAIALLLVRAHLATRGDGKRSRSRTVLLAGALLGGVWIATLAVLLERTVSLDPLAWAVRHDHGEAARIFLELGADPDRPGRWDGQTPLALAAYRRDPELVALLLAAGARVDRPSGGSTPLHYACMFGNRKAADLLLAGGAEASVVDREGQTPLMLACLGGEVELARTLYGRTKTPHPLEATLLAAAEAGDRESVGRLLSRLIRLNRMSSAECRDALQAAAAGNQADLALDALEAGAPVDGAAASGATPLLVACRAGSVEVAARLIDAGARLDAPDRDGVTPLIAAAAAGRPEAVRLLVGRGAAVDARDRGGRDALMAAAASGDSVSLRLLLGAGADPARVDGNGDTARSLALARGRTEAEAILRSRGAPDRAPVPEARDDPVRPPRERLVERGATGDRRKLLLSISSGDVAEVERLLRAGADVNGHDRATNGGTALTWAAYCDQTGVARRLLDLGAEVDGASDDGVTALHEASKVGSAGVVRALLEHQARVDARSRSGRTPLHWASERGHVEVARLLLGRGASPTVVDGKGRTALDMARAAGHDDVVRLLLATKGSKGSGRSPSTLPE